MRIFIKELRETHRAKISALYKRHKNAIGYTILCVGVIIAVSGAYKAIDRADNAQKVSVRNSERARAAVCQNITRQDKTTLENLKSPATKQLIKKFKLSQDEVNKSIRKQLELSAEERRALRPADPESACSGKLTTLKTPIPKVAK